MKKELSNFGKEVLFGMQLTRWGLTICLLILGVYMYPEGWYLLSGVFLIEATIVSLGFTYLIRRIKND